jgi:hypothetical protein
MIPRAATGLHATPDKARGRTLQRSAPDRMYWEGIESRDSSSSSMGGFSSPVTASCAGRTRLTSDEPSRLIISTNGIIPVTRPARLVLMCAAAGSVNRRPGHHSGQRSGAELLVQRGRLGGRLNAQLVGQHPAATLVLRQGGAALAPARQHPHHTAVRRLIPPLLAPVAARRTGAPGRPRHSPRDRPPAPPAPRALSGAAARV